MNFTIATLVETWLESADVFHLASCSRTMYEAIIVRLYERDVLISTRRGVASFFRGIHNYDHWGRPLFDCPDSTIRRHHRSLVREVTFKAPLTVDLLQSLDCSELPELEVLKVTRLVFDYKSKAPSLFTKLKARFVLIFISCPNNGYSCCRRELRDTFDGKKHGYRHDQPSRLTSLDLEYALRPGLNLELSKGVFTSSEEIVNALRCAPLYDHGTPQLQLLEVGKRSHAWSDSIDSGLQRTADLIQQQLTCGPLHFERREGATAILCSGKV